MILTLGLLLPCHGADAAPKKRVPLLTDKVLRALPKPSKSFRVDLESSGGEIRSWPGPPDRAEVAHRVRVYEGRASKDDDDPAPLEVRVILNDERQVSKQPLGSETGDPEAFTQDGLPCTRFPLAGLEDSRLAMPLSDADRAQALTVIRVYVGPLRVTPYLTALAEGKDPGRFPWDGVATKGPDEIRTIVVEYYGPRGEVERLLRATRAAPLRALLSPAP